jgi:hypothetical protein
MNPERKRILEESAKDMLADANAKRKGLLNIDMSKTDLELSLEKLKDIPEDASKNRISLN